MINSSYYRPRIFPYNGDVAPAEIDRAQAIDPSISLNREKVEEIGRVKPVGYIKKSPTVSYRLTQLEYGSIEFWQKLVNSATLGADGETGITLDDFKSSAFDICAYLTDDAGSFKSTVWYPKLRTAGFALSFGDPQAIGERTFDLVGESAINWQGNNKYVHYQREEIESGDTGIFTLTQTAVLDPNDSVYMIRVLRVRGTTTTELVKDTDFTETDEDTVTITTPVVGDVYKLLYTSTTAPANMWTDNDSDKSAILADSAEVYLYIPASGKPSSSDYIYRLQSANIDVRFDREDLREIGNKNVVQRGIKDATISVTLGDIVEENTIEEVLAGQSSDYGKLDVEQFTDQATLIVKIYEDNTKTSFKYGFKATGLSPTELRTGAGINAYVNREVSIEGEDLVISADATVLGI